MGSKRNGTFAGRLLCGSLALLLLVPVRTCADTLEARQGWRVTFTADEKMERNFETSSFRDEIGGLQPGDDITIAMDLANENSSATDWYMTNEVLNSLEDQSSIARGGAYTYQLSYINAAGETTVLFDSDTVGGEEGSGVLEGLREATGALADYFYLDTLNQGQTGRVTLRVALDGETQGNDYQDTLADLQMNFAVELGRTASVTPNPQNEENTPGPTRTQVVKTGDENNVWLFTLLTAAGVIFLILAFFGWKRQEKADNGGKGAADDDR